MYIIIRERVMKIMFLNKLKICLFNQKINDNLFDGLYHTSYVDFSLLSLRLLFPYRHILNLYH